MQVSRGGYYEYIKRWRKGLIKLTPIDKEARRIFKESKESYGSRRMAKALTKSGFETGRSAARTIMKRNGLKVRKKRRYKRTTDSNHKLPVAPNLLERNFNPPKPNMCWAGDITYVWTITGWLYLAVIIDLFSRRVIGWAMSSNMNVDLVSKALKMAAFRRNPPEGLIHHTDRGSQYASNEYRELLDRFNMKQSMSKKGDCWDNSPTERFFGSLKRESLDQYLFRNKEEARYEILDYIAFYNSIRLHSSLDYATPMERDSEAA